ncbi:ribosomal RNA small subunit methyltransferase A [Candidatus Jorgensenbacteria bacterium RIFCSPLOWO2_02_FULL_45_12]|uniref:Dimethyladenosine transferase n=1 Tax=Candidatus Jorgensenbacteria bacterium GW2011_GWA2_45_9 TaxID=1618663 RepID=A0A0G1N510_9BACT|nr:MAG: dimethyladenosine transferase [Candidatus Jorgensenbacteria bacterium GW2011_GWA2_45_9]OGG42377.1 MAG: ribosomal RNA small subunit methyltransferase A [Candidatus Jorgensenbacteria bacterium RIFCSPLOWO2_02_FULL_45_12]
MGQRLGQHFLNNADVLRFISANAGIEDGCEIIEIGPGHGELTEFIVRDARGKRATIIAIEKDKALAEKLKKRFTKNRFSVLNEDAISFLENHLNGKPRGGGKIIVVGNIPYYITGLLLRVLGTAKTIPDRVLLVIQKEVAQRICGVPPKMNILAACVGAWACPTILRIIPKCEFSPKPKVDSAVVLLDKIRMAVPEAYYKFVRVIFAHPRKTILNNLSLVAPKNILIDILQSAGIPENSRPQNISIKSIKTLMEKVYNLNND